MIKDLDDDIDDLPDSDFSRESARVSYEIYHRKDCVLLSSKFVDLI